MFAVSVGKLNDAKKCYIFIFKGRDKIQDGVSGNNFRRFFSEHSPAVGLGCGSLCASRYTTHISHSFGQVSGFHFLP